MHKLICQNCEIEFTGRHYQKCCTRECTIQAQRKNRISIICQNCEKEFKVKPSRANRAKYCSRECEYKFQRSKHSSICLHCKKIFYHRYITESTKYCSIRCYGQAHKGEKRKPLSKATREKLSNNHKGKQAGPDNPNWKTKVELVCIYCRKIFKVIPSYANRARCCSKKCDTEAKKGEMGINHWNWKGGSKIAYERQRNNPKYQLNQRMGRGILRSLKDGEKNHRKWQDLVGYTTEQLQERLISTMPLGYTWQDFMHGKLHIDHKIPMIAFNFNKPEHIDFKRCWALKNLQFLPSRENMSKNAKLYKSFQPSLTI